MSGVESDPGDWVQAEVVFDPSVPPGTTEIRLVNGRPVMLRGPSVGKKVVDWLGPTDDKGPQPVFGSGVGLDGRRNGNLSSENPQAEVCGRCGALLPPYDTAARHFHEQRDARIDRMLAEYELQQRVDEIRARRPWWR